MGEKLFLNFEAWLVLEIRQFAANNRYMNRLQLFKK